MHVYFSGVGGVGIGPLAIIAKQAGYDVSGSDMRDGPGIKELSQKGISNIHIGQTASQIAEIHAKKPIDWLVYSSAVPEGHEELKFCQENNIKTSKRDEFINEILSQKHLKLIAVSGTHGKTTTTAMVVWLFKQQNIPISYSLGAKVGEYDMGAFDPKSQYFIYECDEFDRNFLAFRPHLAIISGLGYDHHEIYPTRDDYNQAFRDFINQSQSVIIWRQDLKTLNMPAPPQNLSAAVGNRIAERQVFGAGLSNSETRAEDEDNPQIDQIELPGIYNRRDGWLALQAAGQVSGTSLDQLLPLVNTFPGVSRRFEQIVPSLYSDDAHTPEKIRGAMSVARELSAKNDQKIIVLYEPLTNRRMHYLAKDHRDVFDGAGKIYWLPSYLAREDPGSPVLTPAELIKNLSPELEKIAEPTQRNEKLKGVIATHLQKGDMVVAMTGGGADSLDDWLRGEFQQ